MLISQPFQKNVASKTRTLPLLVTSSARRLEYPRWRPRLSKAASSMSKLARVSTPTFASRSFRASSDSDPERVIEHQPAVL